MPERQEGFFRTFFRYRELIFFFVYREFRVRYKQTLLGVFWAVLQPFSQMVIFTIVFSCFGKFKSEGVPYPIFVLAGLLPWYIFQGALTRGVPILLNYSNLITKIYFPRVVLLIAATLGLAIDFLCAFAVFITLYFYFGLSIHYGFITSFFVIFIQFIFTIGFLCFISVITVYFRDLNYAIPLFVQLWMFATPVVYSLNAVPARFRIWYDLNPMVGLIHNYRQLLLYGGGVDWMLLVKAGAMSVAMFYFGYDFLRRKEKNISDVIGVR